MGERKPIILCVDDEESPLVLRKLVLQRAGYEVLTANSGTEALRLALAHRVDLVLSDHLMPGMTGTELAQQLKALNPELPILLISGVNEIPPGSNVADIFLSKVEGPDVLCRQVADVLNSRKINCNRGNSSN
jgi:CheY-like chemotaxis protein